MSSKVTHKNLYTLLVEEIEKRGSFNNKSQHKNQQNRDTIAPLSFSSLSGIPDTNVAELITAVQNVLGEALPDRIITGLSVTATEPYSDSVNITAGKGTTGGVIYELSEDTTIRVPLNLYDVVFINLYKNSITLDKEPASGRLTIAKVIIKNIGVTDKIIDTKDDSYDAYIINLRTSTLYEDANGIFEEDTIEKFRDSIGDILADNLIGNIRLSENLTVTNAQGSLLLNSTGLNLYNQSDGLVAKLDRNGTFFYDNNGSEVARFAVDGARIGNILVQEDRIKSINFSSGALGSGFQITDSGEAEFNNILARGKITTSVFEKETISVIGGNLLVMDGDVLDIDMTSSDSSTLTIKGDTTFSVGDILRIKDGVDDEWLEVTNISNAPTYVVNRDKASSYTSNNNPVWSAGTAVTNYKQSGDGGIFMTASESNAPFISVLSHTGSPWSSTTNQLRIGNLNGFLDYSTDVYGIAIGTGADYLAYDPVQGLRISGTVVITGGSIPPKTYYQDEEPPESSQEVPNEGDYWVDTDDSNTLYVYQGTYGDSDAFWESITSGGGGGGITVFKQSGVPTSTSEGDLWQDTDDNKLYRAASVGADEIAGGEWELLPNAGMNDDGILTSAAVPGTNAPTSGAGLYLGADYMGYYSGAAWNAYIKNDGTFKFLGDGSNYLEWNGATLTVRGTLNAEDIDAGYISADRIAATSITAGKLDVSALSAITANIGTITSGTITGLTIIGGTIQTDDGGPRIVMTDTDFVAYSGESGDVEVFRIQLQDDSPNYSGDIIIGDYDNSKGLKWDDSETTFTIKGDITATSGTFTGTVNVGSAGKVYIDGANEVIKVYDASSNLRVELGKLS